jgi:hypothetical protein
MALPCINAYLNKYGDANWTMDERKLFMFTGSATGTYSVESPVSILSNLIFFYKIWCHKLAKKITVFPTVENDMLTIFDVSLNISTRIKNIAITGDSIICRRWRHRSGRG